VPLGKPTILDGDPGLGKSTATLDLAARVSRGAPMPDGSVSDLDGPAGVVLLGAEDDLEDTIRPRLDAARADVARIVALTGVPDRGAARLPVIPDDLAAVELAIRSVDAALVIIDPLMAFLSADTNAHRDQDVRRALAPLTQLAGRTGAAVVVVRHINKSAGGSAIHRGGGSIGIIGAARAGLLVARDPDDPSGDRRILAVTKSNNGPPMPALAFRLDAGDGEVARVVWEGPTAHTADGLLAVAQAGEDRSALQEAEGFLLEALGDGAVPVKRLLTAARDAGVSEKTLRRAKDKLGVRAEKLGLNAGWAWRLSKMANDPEDGHVSEVGQLQLARPSSAETGACARCGRPALSRGLCQTHLADLVALGRLRTAKE
jgi:hypothetical protein